MFLYLCLFIFGCSSSDNFGHSENSCGPNDAPATSFTIGVEEFGSCGDIPSSTSSVEVFLFSVPQNSGQEFVIGSDGLAYRTDESGDTTVSEGTFILDWEGEWGNETSYSGSYSFQLENGESLDDSFEGTHCMVFLACG